MSEFVLSVNGMDYSGWKGISVSRSLEQLTGQFSLSISDKWAADMEPLPIEPEDACQVSLDGIPVITGYVDSATPGFDPDTVTFSVSGRDKTGDLVDCSAVVPNYEFRNATVTDIAQRLCQPFGISVIVETDVGAPFKRHAVQPGETVWNCLERAAKQRGILCTTNGRGDLVLAVPGKLQASDRIVQGKNCIKGNAPRDHRNRYSRYIVNGQEPSWYVGETEPHPNSFAETIDTNVKRHRPLILNSEMQCNRQSAKQRAENEATRRAGECTRFAARVQGWKQSSGELWEPNMQVSVTAPRLHVSGVVFIISTVRYSVADSGGSVVDLDLKRPDAFLYNCQGEVENDWYD